MKKQTAINTITLLVLIVISIELMAFCPSGGGGGGPPPPGVQFLPPPNAPQWRQLPLNQIRPLSGPGISPYYWDQLFNNPTLVSALPMWEKWWVRNRLNYLDFKEQISWFESTPQGETIAVATELRKKIIATLTQAAKEDKSQLVRATAVFALGKTKDQTITPLIKEIFRNDKDFDVKNVSVLTLGILEDISSVSELKEILFNTSDVSYSAIGCAYAALALGYIKNKESIETLKEVFNPGNKTNKETQCAALLSLGNSLDKSLIPSIATIMLDSSRDKSVRAYAALALGRIKDPAALTELKKVSADKDIQLRSSAVIAMGIIKSPESKKELINILVTDKSPEVRAYAAISLAQMGDKSVYEVILKSAKKSDYVAQGLSVIALGILKNEEAVPELIEMLKKKNPSTYGPAIIALGLLKDKISLPVLIKIVEKEETSPMEWAFAIQALGMIGDKQALPALEKALKRASENVELATYAYSNIVIALTMLGKRAETLSYLYNELSNEKLHPEIKYRILYGIAYVGDKNSFEHLMKYYKDLKDDNLRIYSCFALGYLLDKDKINPLYRITADNNVNIWLKIIDHIFISKPD
jgi:HEAT repeat protein